MRLSSQLQQIVICWVADLRNVYLDSGMALRTLSNAQLLNAHRQNPYLNDPFFAKQVCHIEQQGPALCSAAQFQQANISVVSLQEDQPPLRPSGIVSKVHATDESYFLPSVLSHTQEVKAVGLRLLSLLTTHDFLLPWCPSRLRLSP